MTDNDDRATKLEERVAELEAELRSTQVAMHRLVFLMADRKLLNADEVDVVREVLPEYVPPPVTAPAAPAPVRKPRAEPVTPAKPEPRTDEEIRRQRSAAGKIGAHRRWAMETDRSAATQPAREGRMRKLEDQVDPDRRLSPDERAERVEHLLRADMQRKAMRSGDARRRGGVGEVRHDDGT